MEITTVGFFLRQKKFAKCGGIEKCSEVVSCGGVSARTLNTPKFGNANKVKLCISWKTLCSTTQMQCRTLSHAHN